MKIGFILIKKFFSLLTCAVLSASLFCGCGDESGSSNEYYYGQALKEVDGKDIYLIYDGRYVTDDEMDVLTNYYSSIQRKDYELFKTTQPGPYVDFLEKKQSKEVSSYVDDFYKEVEDGVGGDFDFTQIEVTDCGTSREDSGINDIKELLDGIYEDAGMEKSFSDTVNDAKYIVFNLSAESKDGETFNLSDEMKYIFTCEDGTYIF